MHVNVQKQSIAIIWFANANPQKHTERQYSTRLIIRIDVLRGRNIPAKGVCSGAEVKKFVRDQPMPYWILMHSSNLRYMRIVTLTLRTLQISYVCMPSHLAQQIIFRRPFKKCFLWLLPLYSKIAS